MPLLHSRASNWIIGFLCRFLDNSIWMWDGKPFQFHQQQSCSCIHMHLNGITVHIFVIILSIDADNDAKDKRQGLKVKVPARLLHEPSLAFSAVCTPGWYDDQLLLQAKSLHCSHVSTACRYLGLIWKRMIPPPIHPFFMNSTRKGPLQKKAPFVSQILSLVDCNVFFT